MSRQAFCGYCCIVAPAYLYIYNKNDVMFHYTMNTGGVFFIPSVQNYGCHSVGKHATEQGSLGKIMKVIGVEHVEYKTYVRFGNSLLYYLFFLVCF